MTLDLKTAHRRVRAFRVVYAILALQFFVPALSYMFAPDMARETMTQVNVLLGGGAWPVEQAPLWHMLAVGNVMTLAFMCSLILSDLRRFFPALPALVFLKGFSALFSFGLAFTAGLPAFFAVFALDGVTVGIMIFFAVRARRALDVLDHHGEDDGGFLGRAALLSPKRASARAAALHAAGVVDNAPTPAQLSRSALFMLRRLLIAGDEVGTSSNPVRDTTRAKLLRIRALRLPVLLLERAVAPLDLLGLLSSPERVRRHLLAAHHDGDQFLYDFELLADRPDIIRAVRDDARSVVDGTHPRAAWLRDLVVFDGYHEALVVMAERALAGTLPRSDDPALSLRAALLV